MLACALAVTATSASAQRLSLDIGEKDIDVENRTIHFRLGTAAQSAELQLFSPDGELLHAEVHTFEDAKPGERLSVSWPDLGEKGENFRIELKFTDVKDNWIGFQVIRFYMEVPHEEVNFATAKWDIAASEAPKLEEPLKLLKEAVAKYGKLMEVSLYVAGHTDTVGKPADNQLLSEKRARSIAQHFIQRGLTRIPIFVRGFGEGVPEVKTGDEVDEPKNRRAQYILSTFTPAVAGPGSWQRVR